MSKNTNAAVALEETTQITLTKEKEVEAAEPTRQDVWLSLNDSVTQYNTLVSRNAEVDDINAAMAIVQNNLKVLNGIIWDERFAEVVASENPMKELLLNPMTEIYTTSSTKGKNEIATINIVAKDQFVSLNKYSEYCNLKLKKGYKNSQWIYALGGIKTALIVYAKKLNVDLDEMPKGASRVKLFEAQSALHIAHSDVVNKKDMTKMLQYVLDCWIGEGYKVMEQDAKVLRETYFKFGKPKSNKSEAEIVNVNDATFIQHLMFILKRVVTGGKFQIRVR